LSWDTLYFATKFGLSMCPIKPIETWRCTAKCVWVNFFASRIERTLFIT
jgi:hypothetical protein